MPAAAIVGGSVVGGLISAGGAKSAANAQASAASAANATQQANYAQTRQDNMPFLTNGTAASNVLAAYLGISDDSPVYTYEDFLKQARAEDYDLSIGASGRHHRLDWKAQVEADKRWKAQEARLAQQKELSGSDKYGSLLDKFSQDDLNNDVVYNTGIDFALKQGEQGVNRLAAASGTQLSGATLKALQRSGANIGNQYAGDAYNRFNTDQTNIYNRLAGVAGSGQQAVAQVASAGTNAANNISQNQIGLGNARGASAIAQGNALSGAIGQGINSYQQQNYLNSLSNYGGIPYNVNGAASGQF